MHDIDRTMGRTSLEAEGENFEYEFDGEAQGDFEFQAEEEVFGEAELNDLAAELLSVSSEQELDQFLGGLIKKAGRAVGKFVKSPIGQQLGGMLKSVAKKALPMAGAALGNLIVPGVGGAIGGKLASAAGSMFGLELEGLSHEDREFEVAKQFVRLAADTTKSAVSAPPSASPNQVVQRAFSHAAQRFAPGLVNVGRSGGQAMSGRWIRRGRRVILLGL